MTALSDRAKAPSVTITCEAMTYNKDQWISSFEDAMVKLRPHVTMRILTTIGLMAWNKKGTQGVDPALAALEWSQSMDKSRT